MKLYKSILLGAFGLLTAASFTSCKEEDTLSGSDAIYIELNPTDISVAAGDTVFLNATVTNVSGHVINTPVTWSIDDPTVASLVTIRQGLVKGSVVAEQVINTSRAEGDTPEGGEGNEGGDNIGGDTPDPEDTVVTPPAAPVDTTWRIVNAVIGLQGQQGKSTRVRATLENGQYGVTAVSVVARELSKALTPLTTFIRSYQRTANDTAWFAVNPVELLDESEITYKFNLTKVIAEPADPKDAEFTFNFEDPKDNIVIDKENGRVGVVYTGPRMTALAECEMTLTNHAGSVSAKVPIHVYPKISPGFEVDGKRPLYSEPTPSNIKQTLIFPTMDINSTYNVGVCLGIDCGDYDTEIGNVYKAEQAGLMSWQVEGTAVVVEDAYVDFDYLSGYVSYLRVRSGSREGSSTITYTMPDTVLTCNLTVMNYNKTYPVDKITVSQYDEATGGNVPVDHLVFKLGEAAECFVGVEPEASFTFHIPEVTSSDPSVIEVQERGQDDGLLRKFNVHRVGEAVLTITALDKTIQVPVTVQDRVVRAYWKEGNPTEVLAGSSIDLTAIVEIASGIPAQHEFTWHVSDESVATITTTGTYGQVKLNGLKEGTVTVSAEYEGFSTGEMTVTVRPANDIHASDFAGNLFVGDNGDGTFYIAIGNDIFIILPFATDGVYTGTVSGEDGYAEYLRDTFDGTCPYDVTLTDLGDGNTRLSGTVKLPNGITIYLDNQDFFIE